MEIPGLVSKKSQDRLEPQWASDPCQTAPWFQRPGAAPAWRQGPGHNRPAVALCLEPPCQNVLKPNANRVPSVSSPFPARQPGWWWVKCKWNSAWAAGVAGTGWRWERGPKWKADTGTSLPSQWASQTAGAWRRLRGTAWWLCPLHAARPGSLPGCTLSVRAQDMPAHGVNMHQRSHRMGCCLLREPHTLSCTRVSVGNERSRKATSLNALRSSSRIQFVGTTWVPWLVAPPSLFKASQAACLEPNCWHHTFLWPSSASLVHF